MKKIISINSNVCFGYVGNRSGMIPLQNLGYDVIAVNTTNFSNHPGNKNYVGKTIDSYEVKSLLLEISENIIKNDLSGMVTGYIGDYKNILPIVDMIYKLKESNDFIYCLDPVIGDVETGVYINQHLANSIKSNLIELADIITPNVFELEFLTDIKINNFLDLKFACNKLHEKGISLVLVTSVKLDENNNISMFLSTINEKYLITTPFFKFKYLIHGAGDFISALLLGLVLKGFELKEILEKIAEVIYDILKKASMGKNKELNFIYLKDYINLNVEKFEAILMSKKI